jgi:uncharacterized protein
LNFFDASAAAKRYSRELGSERVEAIFHEPAPVCSLAIMSCELTSVLNRKHREGILDRTEHRAAKLQMAQDVGQMMLVTVDAALIGTALRLLDSHPLKTLDSLYLAAALSLQQGGNEPVLFISADRQLLRAAQAEGLKVLDPEKKN